MEKIKYHLTQLLKDEWNGKSVWECIRDKELTSAPAYVGEKYNEATRKIMYVGHAVNGWQIDTDKCKSLEETVDVIMNLKGGLDTFVEKDVYKYVKKNGKEGIYNHINSNFIRLIKQVLECQGESDFPTTEETWYKDSKHWNQKFVWSNLYCLAPWSGGNPDDKLIKKGMEHYTAIIKAQIELYKPDAVIFCPLSGYFTPWKKLTSFDKILDEYKSSETNDPITATGKLGNTQIIVCKRPDRRGTSRAHVWEMAKKISEHIDKVCE